MAQRDIDDYQRRYDKLPFEETMAEIRRKTVLDFLQKNKAKHIIEAGCGNSSILNHYKDFESIIVAEPSAVFYRKLKQDAGLHKEKNITALHAPFTAAAFEHTDISKTDAIIISGLLHEIPDPETMLKDAFQLCNSGTRVHINVPNARSVHRLMALETGLIKELKEKSPMQEKLQQHHTFDMTDLKSLAASCGFYVAEEGSLFIKPFTHAQMQCLQEHPLFGKKITEGFEKLVKYFPGFGTEIWVNLQKRM